MMISFHLRRGFNVDISKMLSLIDDRCIDGTAKSLLMSVSSCVAYAEPNVEALYVGSQSY